MQQNANSVLIVASIMGTVSKSLQAVVVQRSGRAKTELLLLIRGYGRCLGNGLCRIGCRAAMQHLGDDFGGQCHTYPARRIIDPALRQRQAAPAIAGLRVHAPQRNGFLLFVELGEIHSG